MPRPVVESIRFRLRRPAAHVTLIFSHAPARMPLLKNPPVCRLSVNQSVIIYLIGTFPYDDADRSPYAEPPWPDLARPWCAPTNLLLCSHTLCQDTCHAAHNLPLDKSPLWCYHARVHVCGRIPIAAHVPLGLAVSHTGGLTHLSVCVCLEWWVRAALGPVERRFALVPIQTTQLG